MPTQQQTSKQYFLVLTILHSAMLIIQVLFGGIAYFLVSTGQFTGSSDESFGTILQVVSAALAIGGLFGSNFFFKMRLNSIKKESDLPKKLADYFSSTIVKYALLEMPSIFSIVCYLLTSSLLFLGIAALIIAMFFMNRPSSENLANDLELNPSERNLVNDPNAVIRTITYSIDQD